MAEPHAERLARLEERMSAMVTAMGELRADVAKLREERAAARALARDASRRVAWWFAAGGLTLAAVNVAVVVWVGAH